MIEIIPNWHPIFVHFTIALLSMAVVFYVLCTILPEQYQYQKALSLLAKTNLYIGVLFALITAVAGWFAYNSVDHDAVSHLAMTTHRNWALATLAAFLVLAFWSFFNKRKASIFFALSMLAGGGLLSVTGWLGAESVYRYGLGVQSLPQSSGDGHAHEHAKGREQKKASEVPTTTPLTDSQDDVVPAPHDKKPHAH